MNTLQTYWAHFQTWLLATLTKIEESSLFERITLRFEALDPRHQKRVRTAGSLATLFILALLIVMPIVSVIRAKADLANSRMLISDMQSFNADYSVIHKPAPRPAGWQFLSALNLDEAENSLNQFTASIGAPQDATKLERSGNGFTLSITGISLRQVVAIVFQIDGWYPVFKMPKFHVKVSGESRDTLDLEATLTYDSAAAVASNSAGGASSASNYSRDDESGGGGGPSRAGNGMAGSSDFAPPPTPGGNTGGGGAGDDFSGDLPPPPPFEDEL